MALQQLATAKDLAAWIGEDFDSIDKTKADTVLDHASSLVRIAAGVTWADPDTAPDGIPQLTVRVAARGWINPSGSESESTGPFRISYRAMELTAEERLLIINTLNPGARRGLGTISTTRGPLETRNLVDVLPEGEKIDIGPEGF